MTKIRYIIQQAWLRQCVRVVMTLLFQAMRVWWFMTRPMTSGVSAICLTPDNQLLLVYTSYEHGWNLPSGGLKSGESPSEALIRELREEVGLLAFDMIMPIKKIFHRPNYKNDTECIFLLSGVVFDGAFNFEIERLGLFSLDALPPDISQELSTRLQICFEEASGVALWRNDQDKSAMIARVVSAACQTDLPHPRPAGKW